MNNNDLFNKLPGIEKLCVTGSNFIGEEKLNLVVVSTLPVASCPDCGHVSNQAHDESNDSRSTDSGETVLSDVSCETVLMRTESHLF